MAVKKKSRSGVRIYGDTMSVPIYSHLVQQIIIDVNFRTKYEKPFLLAQERFLLYFNNGFYLPVTNNCFLSLIKPITMFYSKILNGVQLKPVHSLINVTNILLSGYYFLK